MVGYPHEIKGQGIYAYVTLEASAQPSEALQPSLAMGPAGDRPDRDAGPDPVGAGLAQDALGQDHAPHAAQDRRERYADLGDISTLAEPGVVDGLIASRKATAAAAIAGRLDETGHEAGAMPARAAHEVKQAYGGQPGRRRARPGRPAVAPASPSARLPPTSREEAAPSDALRHWYAHDPHRWEAFRARYRAELAQRADVLEQLDGLRRRGPLTLVYGARDETRNQAVVLREVLEERRRRASRRRTAPGIRKGDSE